MSDYFGEIGSQAGFLHWSGAGPAAARVTYVVIDAGAASEPYSANVAAPLLWS